MLRILSHFDSAEMDNTANSQHVNQSERVLNNIPLRGEIHWSFEY